MDNDGCTGWFDGNWRHCCDIHDYNYYILNDKFLSDIDLMVCVIQTGNGVMALLMFLGVSLFGWIFYPNKKGDIEMINLPKRSILEIASHEGLCKSAYRDSVGVLTWSIGITNATGHKVDRYLNNPQTLEHCLTIYLWALQKYVNDVDVTFKGYKLTEAQRAAAVSFHYNTGAIKKATWVKEWKAGKVNEARKSIMNYSKPIEIIGRREKERDLFFSEKWTNDGSVSEYDATDKGQLIHKSIRRTNITKALNNVLSEQIDKIEEEKKENSNLISLIVKLIKSFFGVK